MAISLDCLGKLISYNYLVDVDFDAGVRSSNGQNGESAAHTQVSELMETVVDVICDSFVGENTDEKVQLQIIKALLAAVLTSSVPIHQSSLLKAVRTCYNIFLLSRNSANQTIAQATLTQMVHQVFGRVKVGSRPTRSPAGSESSTSLASTVPVQTVAGPATTTEPTTLSEERKSLEEKIIEELKAVRQEAEEEQDQEMAEGTAEDFVDATHQPFTDEAAEAAESAASPGSPVSATYSNKADDDLDEDFESAQQVPEVPEVAEVEASFSNVDPTYVNGNGESSDVLRRDSAKTLVASRAATPKQNSDPLTL